MKKIFLLQLYLKHFQLDKALYIFAHDRQQKIASLSICREKHITCLNACTLKWTLSHVSSDKQRKLGRGNTLADGQDSDSFHICFKKIDIWEKRSEDVKRTNIILFQ